MSEVPPNRWFVVQVRPKAEKMVACLLRSKGYEDFLPLYRPPHDHTPHAPRESPLFPGYVFCRSTRAAGSLIVTTPGVVRILSIGGKACPVDDIEIGTLRAVEDTGYLARPWPKLEPGDLVTIMEGPLSGCRGVLKCWKNRTHLLVSVELLQRSVLVTLPVQKISPKRAQTMNETQVHKGPLSETSLRQVG